MSQTNSNDIKKLFDRIHPGNQELNTIIIQFLLKLGIQTVEDLAKSDLMQLLKKVEEIIPNYIELIEMYWQYFLQVAYVDYRRTPYPKDPSRNENFDEGFINFIRGISEIYHFQEVLGWRDALISDFENLKEDNEKIITNQEKFVERAYKEIEIISKFVEDTISQINSRKFLNQTEIGEREKQLQHLISLINIYDIFNHIIVKDEDHFFDLDSSWLDEVGGWLKDLINFINSSKLEKLVPWTDKEIVKVFLRFWKYKALT